jgi:hypothetical protein
MLPDSFFKNNPNPRTFEIREQAINRSETIASKITGDLAKLDVSLPETSNEKDVRKFAAALKIDIENARRILNEDQARVEKAIERVMRS